MRQTMKELIEIDLFDDLRDGNDKFFQLLDFSQWEVLKAKYADPDNEKSMNELVTELMEGR